VPVHGCEKSMAKTRRTLPHRVPAKVVLIGSLGLRAPCLAAGCRPLEVAVWSEEHERHTTSIASFLAPAKHRARACHSRKCLGGDAMG
jgi:hypothetical protein